MSEETTMDRLAEIEGQAADYTPPEGWRVLQVGEALQPGDAWAHPQANLFEESLNLTGVAGSHGYYLRRIEPQPEPEAEPQPVQVREGRWRTRGGEIKNIKPCEPFRSAYYAWPWTDGYMTFQDNGFHMGSNQSVNDLVEYLGPITPEPEPEPENCGFEGKILREQPQPVQIREGRWRTRGGEIRHITPTPKNRSNADRFLWHDAHYNQTWLPSGHYTLGGESRFDLVEYLGPIESEADRIITPDDVAAEALAGVFDQGKAERQIVELQAQVAFLKNRELTLGTRLQEEKAVTAKRLQQVEELRSEVSHVQGLLGESSRRVAELETLVGHLRAVNAANERAVNSADRDKADLQHRLDTVAAEWAQQAQTISRLEALREAVKAELVQERLERNQWQNHAQRTETQLVEKVSECRNLRIELDALQQAPQAEPVAAVPTSTDDRFEQGWDQGTARAVETIAEWLEPLRKLIDAADNVEQTERASNLAADIMQNLPHIMRTLTGLADED